MSIPWKYVARFLIVSEQPVIGTKESIPQICLPSAPFHTYMRVLKKYIFMRVLGAQTLFQMPIPTMHVYTQVPS